jgi:hypothetical protein
MVGTALKPHYKRKMVSKDQYTDMNRSISRMLYERVGEIESLEPDSRDDLERAAKFEVQRAIDALPSRNSKEKQPMTTADSDGDGDGDGHV